MDEEQKKRFGFYLPVSLIEQIDSLLQEADVNSRNEFVAEALKFYIGYLTSQKIEDYILQSFSSVLGGIVQDTENRIARMEFKLAVETSMLAHLIAYHADDKIDSQTFRRLLGKCVEEVKSLNGAIDLERAYRYQKGEV